MRKVLLLFVLFLVPLTLVVGQQTTYKVELQYNITNSNNTGSWNFSSIPYNETNIQLGPALISVYFSGPGTKQVNINEVITYSRPITDFQYFSGGGASCNPFGQGPQFASFAGSQCSFVDVGRSMCLSIQPGSLPNLNKLFPLEDLVGLNPGSGNIDGCGGKNITVGSYCRFKYRLYAVYQSNQIEILPYGEHDRVINITRTGNLTQIPYGQPFSLQVEYVNNPIKPADTSSLLTGQTFVPCPPDLDGTVNQNPGPITPTCVGDSDGGFDVTFDRVLRSDEKMSIFVHPGTTDPTIIESKQNLEDSDFTGRTYRFLGTNLPAGSYRMSYVVGPIVANAFPTVPGSTDGFFTINDPIPVTFTQSTNNASCAGTADGSITVSPQGGTGPYQYLLTPNGGSETTYSTSPILALADGDYSLRIRDSNGCFSTPQNVSIQATSSEPILNMATTSINQLNEAPLGAASITLGNISGGNGSYTYAWTRSPDSGFGTVTTGDLTTLTEGGVYSLVITSGTCVSQTYQFTINDIQPLTVAFSTIGEANCEGDTATIQAQGQGGTGGYTYLWSTGATTPSINVPPGTYSVTVSDGSGTTTNDFFTLDYVDSNDGSVITELLSVSIAGTTNVVCRGDNTGAIDLTITGGTGTYEVFWDGSLNASTEDRTDLLAGPHYYRVRDVINDCIITNISTPIMINEPPLAFEVSATSTDATSNGGNDGTISLTLSNGGGGYGYVWTKDGASFSLPAGSTSTEIVGLQAGVYQVIITDTNGCVATLAQAETIDEPGPLALQDPQFTMTPVDCFGASTGSITARYNGTAPFTFIWRDSGNNILKSGPDDFLDNQPAGFYTYTVDDATTAVALTSNTIEITEPTSSLSAGFTQTEVTCFGGNDGSITVTALGGTSPYTYELNGGIPQTSGIFPNLAANNYTVLITDANNCTATINPVLDPPSQISFDDANAVTPVSSPGGSDGSISVTVQGGAQPYFYRWSGPAILAPINTANTTTLLNLSLGTYTLEVSNKASFDIDGCYFTRQYTVTEQDAFSIQSFDGADTCFGQSTGSLTATIVATGLVTFNWFEVNDPINPIASQTTLLRTLSTQNLGAGTYYLEIVDANNVTVRSVNDIAIVELAEVSATINAIPTCLGLDTGSITFSNPSGSPSNTYSYSINNGLTFQASPLFENLAAGNYTPRVSIAENNTCDFIAPGVVIGTSPGLFYDEPNTTVTRASGPGANDGAITAVFIGGTLPLSYSWSHNVLETNASVTGLTQGIYTVTVTDAAGCFISEPIEITEVGPLSISNIVPTNVLCRGEANGSITTTVTGEGTITYLWTLTDGSPVPVSNGVTTQNIDGVLAGSYILTATDDNTTLTTAPIIIGEPATSVTITNIIPTDISCFGGNDGSLEIQAGGGTGPYMYSINGGTYQASPIFNNLIANSYSVRVQDVNTCEFIEPTPTLLLEPQELSFIINEQRTVTSANATDGAIFITVEGGSGSYSYSWTGPNGFSSTDEDILNLAEGDYTITITDDNFAISNGTGCRLVSAPITITEPGQLLASLDQTILLECYGDDFGEITANVQGGVTPYVYEWFQVSNGNNNLLAEDTNIIGNLSVGTYFVRATDANSISVDSNPLTITAPTEIEINVDNTTNVLCAGQPTGAIDITVSGGSPPYQYFWSNSATVPNITGLDAGEYIIDVEDAAGCIAQRSVTITTPVDGVQVIDATITNVSVYQAIDGSITLDVSGGLPPYSYSWTRQSDNVSVGNEATIPNLGADSYSVSISDSNGCTISEIYEVTQPDIIEETIIQPSCSGESDGSISVLANQGNGAFTYLWNNGATENSIDNLPAGNYTVTVTGFADGPETRTYLLENPIPLEVNLGIDRVLCANQTLDLDATVDDETATYSWNSDNGFTSSEPNVVLSETGNYVVTVQSQTGCTTQGSIFINVSTDEIDAEFAMSSQAFVGETVIAVDLSFPLPEGIEWIVPIGASIVSQDKDAVEFSFAEAGEYDITVITSNGDCIAQKTKKLLVVAKDGLIQEEDSKNGQKVVEEFIVYPNPTDGKFTTDINLTERGDVSVKVFSFANNALMVSQKERGESNYSIPFDISGMPSGVYAVLLETPFGTSLRKIVVR